MSASMYKVIQQVWDLGWLDFNLDAPFFFPCLSGHSAWAAIQLDFLDVPKMGDSLKLGDLPPLSFAWGQTDEGEREGESPNFRQSPIFGRSKKSN